MTEQDLTFEMMFSEVRNSLYISPPFFPPPPLSTVLDL